VLAVGDLAFQKKCLGKVHDVSRGGRTVLFVSHDMLAIANICRRAIVLDQGRVAFDGPTDAAIQNYRQRITGRTESARGHVVDLALAPRRSRAVRPLLSRLEFFTDGDRPLEGGLRLGDGLKVRIHFALEAPTVSVNVGMGFINAMGQRVVTAHSVVEPDRSHGERVGPQVFVCDIPSLTLVPGEYTLRVWLDIANAEVDAVDDAARLTIVEADFYGSGKVPLHGTFVLRHRWYLDGG
jgi:lipopolysaccharide transport system ATP-binding protein